MKRLIANKKGFSLMETMVSIGISAFVFAILGYMVFACARSAVNIHAQSVSQTSASTAAEGITAALRNGLGYSLCSTDTGMDPVTRIYVEFPQTTVATTTHTVALKTLPSGKKEVQYFNTKISTWDAEDGPDTSEVPIHKYRVQDFGITFVSQYELDVRVSFTYKAFALIFDNPGIPQHGDFVTKAIAKNHFIGQGVENYADPTTSVTIASY